MTLPGRTAALVAATFVVSFAFSTGPDALRMDVGAALVISAAAAAVVLLSTVRPALALIAGSVMAGGLPLVRSTFEVMDLVLVVVAFQASARSRVPVWAVTALCFTSLTVTDIWTRVAFGRSFAHPSILYPAVLTTLAIGFGLQSRRIREQHAELLALRDADRRRIVSDERRRIARDLHDIAAHHLSALVVRNGLARRVGTAAALDAAATFSAETATDALDSIRQVVRVLNTDDSPLSPQPGLADLEGVIARMGAAGLETAYDRAVIPAVTRDVEVAVVRIVQEALANVLRHRGPGRCWLSLSRHGAMLHLVVEDDGPSPPRTGLLGPGQRPASYGLVGMRERAEACGGTLVVDRSPRGGWRIASNLPCASAR